MKCQKCEKTATFHITEIRDNVADELHFCEEHAKVYLTQGEESQAGPATMAGALAQQLASVTATAEELARLDQQVCPICGISFYEFRNQGRFGCPHDYTYFQQELEPLLMNIHGELAHTGKRPRRGPADTSRQTELIRMRREMADAVEEEDYERASQLRDAIREIEREKLTSE